MRAALAAALAAVLVLVATACGSSSAATSSLSTDAASLVPSSALAYVSADSSLNSDAWSAIKKLTGPLDVNTAAVGDELNVAVLGVDQGKPEAVAIVKPKDESKLQALLAKENSKGNEHYTVQQVNGWSVVADSSSAFDAVRGASSGTSLADTQDFKQALSQLSGNAVAFAYAKGSLAQQLPANVRPLVGSARWFTAQVTGDANQLQLDAHGAGASLPTYKPTLLSDVPSGAILAASFKNASQLPLKALKPYVQGINGEGVLYVVPGAILPVITLEVRAQDPAAAEAQFHKIAAKLGPNLPLNVERRGNKVLLTTAAAGLGTGGKSILDDKAYQDALKAAGAPGDVTFLAYADVNRLAPLVQAFGGMLGIKNPPKLDNVNTLVAYGGSDRAAVHLTLK
jgi:hypothetical protein